MYTPSPMTQLDPIVVFLQIWENAHILVFSPILTSCVSMMADGWIVVIVWYQKVLIISLLLKHSDGSK